MFITLLQFQSIEIVTCKKNLSGMKRIRRKSFIIASLLQFSKHWGQNFDITQNLQNVDTIKIYKAQLYWITVSTLDQREY